jgi:hypothetical protein
MVARNPSPSNNPSQESLPLLYKRLSVVKTLIRSLERYREMGASSAPSKRNKAAA